MGTGRHSVFISDLHKIAMLNGKPLDQIALFALKGGPPLHLGIVSDVGSSQFKDYPK